MTLSKYKLGDLLEYSDDRNDDSKYTLENVKGISIQKTFIETKADMQDVSLKPYKIVKPDDFAYVTVTSRNGEKITLAHNITEDTYIVSSSYEVFRVKETGLLLSDYLFIYFNRPEFDRYTRYNSWGSAREIFSWEDMCDIEIELPSIEIQKKYVDVYVTLLNDYTQYQNGLNDLEKICNISIENLRKSKREKIGNRIKEVDCKNSEGKADEEMGVSIQKKFFATKAKSSDVESQKLVCPKQFAFNTNTSRNSESISIALNNTEKSYAVSNTYQVFECDESLMPEYLFLWFKRSEFNRFARFYSWGSARETIDISEIKNYEISIPSLEQQKSFIDLLSSYEENKRIGDDLKEVIKDICPILIKGSLEAQKEA